MSRTGLNLTALKSLPAIQVSKRFNMAINAEDGQQAVNYKAERSN
jgi:hypothetical protein